jgi:hypothetical protein
MEWNDEILFEENAEPVEVTIREEEVAEPEPVEETAEETAYLSAEEVQAHLAERKVNALIVERVSARQYAEMSEVDEAVQAEQEYIKAVTGAGRPFSMGESQRAPAQAVSTEERDRRIREANQRWLGTGDGGSEK